jgi:hypothetical protein
MESGDGQSVHVPGGDVTMNISSRDTGGAFAVFEGKTEPLEGPPLHLHHDKEELVVRSQERIHIRSGSAGAMRACWTHRLRPARHPIDPISFPAACDRF